MNRDRNRNAEVRSQISEDRSQEVFLKYKILFSVFCLLFFVLLSHSIGNSEETVEIRSIRHWSTADHIRVIIDLSRHADFTKGKLSNPERLFFDIKNAKITKGLQTNLHIGGKTMKMVRAGQFNINTVRVVFDLETLDYDFKTFSLEDPPRLVVDISSKMGVESRTDVKTEAKISQDYFRKKVVIDPGHGGHDPGAVGPNGLYEKDVVLDIALRVRDIMKREYPHYEVVLTREKDIFIPLKDRAKIANNAGADLFLSIHANASPNKQARGIETYFLNWTDDEDALRVAARENAISVKKMKQVQSELGFILASLERDRKRDDSIRLAGNIHKSMVETVKPRFPKVNDLGIKSALFYVLVDAEMASALAEVSFISNREEERLLSDDAYRQNLAYSIVSGINAYFSATPQQPQQKVMFRDSVHDNLKKVKHMQE